MMNLVPHIKKIVATPRFMLIHSENQIISACQHTGIQIAQISRNVFFLLSIFSNVSIMLVLKTGKVKSLTKSVYSTIKMENKS